MAKVVLPILILVAAVAGAVVLVKNRPQPEEAPVTENLMLVEVMRITPEDTYITVPSQGTVEARTRTSMVSEVSGQVIEISSAFVAGGFFHEGDILLRLDDSNYRAAVSRDRAAVASARSQLEQEKGQADVAQREWDQMSAERQAQVRARDLYLRKPQLEEAQARLASAEADLEQSLRDLSRTVIVAPYDGLVSSKNTDLGQFVTQGSTIAETFAVDYAEVRLPIPENKIPLLDLPSSIRAFGSEAPVLEGPEVELTSEIGDTVYSWTGHLTRTEGVLDTRTRVLFSVVQIQDPYGLYGENTGEPLRIGTYVNASIKGKQLENVITLPRHTLKANNVVWVTDQENRLRPRDITVVAVNGDNVYISEGFMPGDQVVLTRLENPLNSTKVLIRQNESKSSLVSTLD